MTTPSGQISLSQVNTELAFPATATISMNDAAVRALAGVPSGAISMQNLQNKSNLFSFTLSSATNVNLHSAALTAGWPGSGAVEATIPSTTTISSTSTGTAALTVDGAWPGGVTLFNQGLIVGRGGNGGQGGGVTAPIPNGTPTPGFAGASGGVALSVSSAISINNSGGTVAGGGGGGGGGGSVNTPLNRVGSMYAGGGGGGGIGVSTGGSGGDISAYVGAKYPAQSGGNGTTTALGTGAPRIKFPGNTAYSGAGGNGGTYGSGGATGGTSYSAIAGRNRPGGSGGAAGAATAGNSNITWIVTGTRLGALN